MAKNHLLMVLIVAASVVASCATTTTSNSSTTPTVYETLAKYNFPPGILPEGIRSHTIHADGSFDVTVPDCFIDAAGYEVRYESKISGSIQSMAINGLQGVSLHIGINYLPIVSVERVGDQLTFDTEVASNSFPVGNFAASPRCKPGIGFPK